MDQCPSHPEAKLQSRGRRARKDGTEVARFWCPAEGGHSLREVVPGTGPVPEPRRRTSRTPYAVMRCANARHADAKVVKNGTYTTPAGTWQRYLCRRPNGQTHTFGLLTSPTGSVVSSLTPPPACPEHANSVVVRAGKHRRSQKQVKSKSNPSLRQRYLCVPADGEPSHRFVAPLGREVVQVGTDACAECEELLSPHRGTQAVSRRSRHPLKAVVACLAEISAGTSYAQASRDLRARTQHAIEHRRTHHRWLDEVGEQSELDLPDYLTSTGSAAGTKSKNGWRLAADLTEQYAPVLWGHLNERVSAREQAQRARNDEVLAATGDAVLAHPIVWVLDELPVITHRSRNGATRFEQTRWHMLVVTEVRWQHTARAEGELFDGAPMRDAKLRLVRAYPGASGNAWRLVLDELGVRPDFVVSDFGSAIGKALAGQYPPGSVGHVPSFFHMARNIRTALRDKPGATRDTDQGTELVEELEKSLDGLTRADLLAGGRDGWVAWWDGFITTLLRLGVPAAGFIEQRRIYEQPVGDAFALLDANPHLPASNAAVETKIRMKLEPLLVGRKQRYRNLARTNRLLDLAVCREQGLFLDTDAVAGLIRDYNNAAGGWAPKGREVCDIHPSKTGPPAVSHAYSSLLDPFITDALYTQRLGSA